MELILPLPPNCKEDEANRVAPGDIAVVSLQEGVKIAGQLLAFEPQKATIVLQTKGKDSPTQIPIPSIQAMHLPNPKEWTGNGEDGDTPDTQEFEIFFTNGKRLAGDTLGYCADDNGIHLFPIYGKNKFMHSFVPFTAMVVYRVGDESNAQGAAGEPGLGSNVARDVSQFLTHKAITNTEELERVLSKQKTMPNMKLGEILLSEELVTEDQLKLALEEQKLQKNTPLGEILVKKGLVTPGEIQQSLAKKLGIPFVDLRKYQPSPDVLSLVPQDIAEKHKVIPIHRVDDKLVVALENPMNWDALDALRFNTNMHVEPVMAMEKDITWAVSFYYSPSQANDASIEELADDTAELADYSEDDLDSVTEEITDNVVVKLLNKIILDARNQDASDIHIEPSPGKSKIVVRFRQDGTLVKYHELPPQYRSALISRIKILAKLDISEKRRPQDGKIEFKNLGGSKLELRVAILPTVNGQEDVVMRILASGKPIALGKLALSQRNHDELIKAISTPYGLFLVCGPTGSGKTTSLHSILGHINTPERKIWTAEDPVEITQAGLRQVQVNSKIGVTFAAAMRSFLRADPDVIMVGEMRDKETVQTGIEASLTGHLVFSTLHTNSAPESIVRLLDMGMDPFNFADALLGVLAQRLCKRLCSKCKEPYEPTQDELMHLAAEYCAELVRFSSDEEAEKLYVDTTSRWKKAFGGEQGDITLYKPAGCPQCNDTGYKGRIGLHELLIGTDAVKKDILEHAPVSSLLATALKEGMTTLRMDGLEKVLQGHTDPHAVRAVCSK